MVRPGGANPNPNPNPDPNPNPNPNPNLNPGAHIHQAHTTAPRPRVFRRLFTGVRDHHLHHRHRGAPYQQFFGPAAQLKHSPRAVPELRAQVPHLPGACLPALGRTRPAGREAAPLIAQPLPRVLELEPPPTSPIPPPLTLQATWTMCSFGAAQHARSAGRKLRRQSSSEGAGAVARQRAAGRSRSDCGGGVGGGGNT